MKKIPMKIAQRAVAIVLTLTMLFSQAGFTALAEEISGEGNTPNTVNETVQGDTQNTTEESTTGDINIIEEPAVEVNGSPETPADNAADVVEPEDNNDIDTQSIEQDTSVNLVDILKDIAFDIYANDVKVDATTPIDRDAALTIAMACTIDDAKRDSANGKDIVYDMPAGLNLSERTGVQIRTALGVTIGTLDIKDGKVTIRFNDEFYKQSNISFTVNISASLDKTVTADQDNHDFEFTGTNTDEPIRVVVGYTDAKVTGDKEYTLNDDGTVTFTVALTTDSKTTIDFKDTLGKNFTFVAGSFMVDGVALATQPTIEGNVATGTIGEVNAGTYMLTYKANRVDSSTETDASANTVEWSWGDKTGTDKVVVDLTKWDITAVKNAKLNADGTVTFEISFNLPTKSSITITDVLGGNFKFNENQTYTLEGPNGFIRTGERIVFDGQNGAVALGALEKGTYIFSYTVGYQDYKKDDASNTNTANVKSDSNEVVTTAKVGQWDVDTAKSVEGIDNENKTVTFKVDINVKTVKSNITVTDVLGENFAFVENQGYTLTKKDGTAVQTGMFATSGQTGIASIGALDVGEYVLSYTVNHVGSSMEDAKRKNTVTTKWEWDSETKDAYVDEKEWNITGQKVSKVNSDGTVTFTVKLSVPEQLDGYTIYLKDTLGTNFRFTENPTYTLTGNDTTVNGNFTLDASNKQIATATLSNLAAGDYNLSYTVNTVDQKTSNGVGNKNVVEWTWGKDGDGEGSGSGEGGTGGGPGVGPYGPGKTETVVDMSQFTFRMLKSQYGGLVYSADKTTVSANWVIQMNMNAHMFDMNGAVITDNLPKNMTFSDDASENQWTVKAWTNKNRATPIAIPSDVVFSAPTITGRDSNGLGGSFTYVFPTNMPDNLKCAYFEISYKTTAKTADLGIGYTRFYNWAKVIPVGCDDNGKNSTDYSNNTADNYCDWEDLGITINPETSVSKENLNSNADGVAEWTSTLGIEKLLASSYSADGGKFTSIQYHDYIEDIIANGTYVGSYFNEDSLVLTSGGKTLVSGTDYTVEYKVKSNSKDAVMLADSSKHNEMTITFKIVPTKDVVVSYKTTSNVAVIPDEISVASFRNIGELVYKYKDNYNNDQTQKVSANASWQYTNHEIPFSKSAVKNSMVWDEALGAYTFSWKLSFNFDSQGQPRADINGITVAFTDTLPEGMEYVNDSATVKISTSKSGSPLVEEQKLNPTINENVLSWSSEDFEGLDTITAEKYGYVINFKTVLKDDFADDEPDNKGFVKKDYKNSGSAVFGDKTRTDEDTYTVTIEKLAKNGTLNAASKDQIDYVIDVNQTEATLNENKAYTLTDVLPEGWIISRSSIEIVDGHTNAPAEFKWTYDSSSREVTFTVEDAKYLKVKYSLFRADGEAFSGPVSNSVTLRGKSTYTTVAESTYEVQKVEAFAKGDTTTVNLQKMDMQMNPIDAKFTVKHYYQFNNGAFSQIDTIKDNELTSGSLLALTHLIPGDLYSYEETEAPAGFVRDEKVHYFILDGSNVENIQTIIDRAKAIYGEVSLQIPGTIQISNHKYGEIAVTKVDAADNAVMLAATFTIYTDEACQTVAKDINGNDAVITTDATTGKGTFTGMQAGTYYVKETTAPNGYFISNEVYKVTVANDKTAVVSNATVSGKQLFTNNKIPDNFNITVSKTDIAGAALAGAELAITDADGNAVQDVFGNTIANWTSTTEAKTINGLKPGTYELSEVNAPAGHTKAAAITFVIADDGTVTVNNAAVANNAITMVDGNTQKTEITGTKYFFSETPLAADMFTFELYEGDTAEGTPVATTTNDADGNFKFDIEIDKAGNYTYTVVEKAGTNSNIFYDDSVYTVTFTATADEANGNITLSDMFYSYCGNTTENATNCDFYNNEVQNMTFSFRSLNMAGIEGTKVLLDAGNKMPITYGQFRFDLYDAATNEVVKTAAVDPSNTENISNFGFAYRYVQPGTYEFYVKEQNAGLTINGVHYDDTVYYVTVTVDDAMQATVVYKDADGNVVEALAFENTAVTQVDVSKVWDDNDNAQGVRPESLKVTLFANGVESDSVMLSDANNWRHSFGNLQSHDDSGNAIIYTAEEEPVENYTSAVATTNEGTYTSYTFTNSLEAATSVVFDPMVNKTLTGEELTAGQFTFNLYDDAGSLLSTMPNDDDGKVIFPSITLDKVGVYHYTISEVKTDDPHIVYDEATIEAEVTVSRDGNSLKSEIVYSKDGEVTEAPTFENAYYPVVLQVQKTSKTDGNQPLYNATYTLYRVNEGGSDVLVSEAKSDENGMLRFTGIEIDAEYYFKEVAAPAGHTVDAYQSETFKVYKDENGNVQIMSVSGDSTEYYATTAGEEITLNAEGVSDEATELTVSKIDSVTREFVQGAVLQIIEKSTGTVVYEWTTTDAAASIVKVLNVGTEYILREKSAPADYTVAQDTVFVIDDYGNMTVKSGSDAEWVSDKSLNILDAPVAKTVVQYVYNTVIKDVEKIITSPQTGDNAPIILAVIMIISGVFAVCVLEYRKKKKNHSGE